VEVHPTTFFADGLAVGTGSADHVALALDALEAGLHDERRDNVGYHEFAHALDHSDGIYDGVPPLLVKPELRRSWVRVLADDLARLRAAVAAGEPIVLPEHASENEAELFACATETFFARPDELLAAHPALYALLNAYYAQDPRAA